MKITFYTVTSKNKNKAREEHNKYLKIMGYLLVSKFKTLEEAKNSVDSLENVNINKIVISLTKRSTIGKDAEPSSIEPLDTGTLDTGTLDAELYKFGINENQFICDVQFPQDIMHTSNVVKAVNDFMFNSTGRKSMVEMQMMDKDNLSLYSDGETFVVRKKNIRKV